MKICMLAPEFLPVWGGVGTYIIELVRHLPKNIEIHVVTPLREGFGKQKVSTVDYDFNKYFGSNVHAHFVCKADDTFLYNAGFQYACLKYIPKLIKEYKIDLIHSHTAHMPDLLLQFKRLKVPTVTTIHTTIRGQREGAKCSGVGFWGLDFSEKMTFLAYPFLQIAESIYFSGSRHYITVSKWMRRQIVRQYPKINSRVISVIYNSVDTRRFSPSKRYARRDIILFTGRLIAAKGIRYLIEAIPKVIHEHPDALFIFIGAGNPLPYLKRLKELRVPERNFAFLGYIRDSNDLVKYYRASSVYVAPSLYENLPIRVLEAMACGVPVAASNVCAIPEAIDNWKNGVLIRPMAIKELSDAICCLLSDFNLRQRLGRNARRKVLEKFDWKVNAFRTAKIYEQCLS
ncbi:MAG: glycosyltransferase family 4 protein [Candidatus Bathyarchaeia archaeon]